ncbi:DUF6597 domain-containing transcriptional factor [Streptomyces sp. NPDC096193]|uniref:DUF6597 domain-containing transcriptional factor n=1 Tax=Streptomyces sp. NPDC096193 TaxID=3155821 RepID=UPI00332E4177
MYVERPSRLKGAVVWTRTLAGLPGPAHPVLPDGCMDLIVVDGRLLVAGPDSRAQIADTRMITAMGVRFAPGTAPALLGVPAHELRDRRVDIADLWGATEARRLTERILTAADPVGALEAVAIARAADAGRPDPVLGEVVRRLDEGGTVAGAASAAGLGARQLHRRSLAAFGYGPKTLARVLRLQRALTLVRAGVPYADAALTAGCADQAHLAREMRDLGGTTLSAYAESAKNEIPQPSGSSTTA